MITPSATPPPQRFLLLRRVFRCLLCVLAAWCVLILYLLLRYYFLHLSVEGGQRSPDWWRMPFVIALYGLPYIGGTWLVVVLPLFLSVGARSLFRRWPIAAAVFGAIGAVVMLTILRFDVPRGFGRFVGFAALTGAATGLFCSIAQRPLHRATNVASSETN